VRPHDRGLIAEDGAHLVDVERLPLRQVLHDVDEDDVAVVAGGEHLRARRTDVAGADNRDLAPTHTRAASESMIASASSLVQTAASDPKLAPGASPSPPTRPAARSETMSP